MARFKLAARRPVFPTVSAISGCSKGSFIDCNEGQMLVDSLRLRSGEVPRLLRCSIYLNRASGSAIWSAPVSALFRKELQEARKSAFKEVMRRENVTLASPIAQKRTWHNHWTAGNR